ncbi:MAG: Crp/Fnr family transcriptional regulator [Endomicrobia bacterium]|nr:Crp/Fnr family transcriptional regulator [Endomicrobiia bacterium]MCL2506633.1 Crp/Fnr family transcriptional regulator [Endomicrobiia bacterium]
MEYIKKLTECPLFEGISEAKVESVLRRLNPKIRKYKKGEYIVVAGNPVTDIFILLQGSVQLIIEDISGSYSLIAQPLPGESFFEVSATLNLQKTPVSCYAKADSLVMTIPFKNIQSNPVITKNLILTLAHKSYKAFAQLEHVSRRSVRKKILSYLSAKKNQAGKNEFVIPISQTDLADYLFISRTALTRELMSMKKDNLISYNGRKFTIKTN